MDRGSGHQGMDDRPRQVAVAALALFIGWLAASPAQALSPSKAAARFAETLSGDERLALQAKDSPDRNNVRLTPGRRLGLTLGAMDGDTRSAAMALLGALLSDQGMAMIRTVREREAKLAEIEGNPEYRDKDKYYLTLFGDPGDGDWALRFEGHHLSINVALVGGRVVGVLPFLIGANPPEGPAGDVLLPFVRSAETPAAFAANFAALFRAGTAVPGAAEMEIDLTSSFFGGHPHLSVTRK